LRSLELVVAPVMTLAAMCNDLSVYLSNVDSLASFRSQPWLVNDIFNS